MSMNNFNEADSTDWLETPLRSLSQVDAALRCQVCKDFYITPMITSCCHTFCSLCIRRCLSNDGRCPACRAQEQELRLRNNGAVEELVEAFKRARTEVLDFAKEPIFGSASTKRKREDNLSGDEISSLCKRTRSSTRSSLLVGNVIDHDTDDADYIPEDGMVQCPVCAKYTEEKQINAHLDRNCEAEPYSTKPTVGRTSKYSTASSQTVGKKVVNRPDRLPQINLSMVKDAGLKKKLAEQGLSTVGSRLAMEKRFTEWITLWNANCDAKIPKPKMELRNELDRWERVQNGRGPGTSSLPNYGPQIKGKDFDGKAWSDAHSDSFQELVKKARQAASAKVHAESLPAKIKRPPLTEDAESSPISDVANIPPKFIDRPKHAESWIVSDDATQKIRLPPTAQDINIAEPLVSQDSAKQSSLHKPDKFLHITDCHNLSHLENPPSSLSNKVRTMDIDSALPADVASVKNLTP